jgi:hypothetical protein
MRSERDKAIKDARKRAKAKNKWRSELMVWIGVSLLLLFINGMSGSYPWWLWASVPWGATLLMRRLVMWSTSRDEKVEAKEIKKALKRRGLAEEYADDFYDDEEMDDELELDDMPEQKAEVLRPKRRWDENDLV